MSILNATILAAICTTTIVASAHAGGGYAGGSLSGAYAEDEFGGETDEGAGVSLRGGYAIAPYFAVGARADSYYFESDVIEYNVGTFFLEGTLSTHRKNRAYGYSTLGVGFVSAEAELGGLDVDDDSGAASLELGVMFNVGQISSNMFEIGPMIRYTYVDELFDSSIDIYQVGVRLGWNGYPTRRQISARPADAW